MTQDEKPHLKAANHQQGVNVVGAEVLHNGLQVELGQRPVVGEIHKPEEEHAAHKTRVSLTPENR